MWWRWGRSIRGQGRRGWGGGIWDGIILGLWGEGLIGEYSYSVIRVRYIP
jgi:hypothetical protein